MSMIGSYLIGWAEAVGSRAACSDEGLNPAFFIRTSEQECRQNNDVFRGVRIALASNIRTHKIKRARAGYICMRMTGPLIMPLTHPIMPLTSWGAGGFLLQCPPKARPNCLQTRQGEKTARRRTETYFEGVSSQPNDVSSDLVRFGEIVHLDKGVNGISIISSSAIGCRRKGN